LIDYQHSAGRQIELLTVRVHSYMTVKDLHGQPARGSMFVNGSVGLHGRNHHAEVREMNYRFGIVPTLPVRFLLKLLNFCV